MTVRHGDTCIVGGARELYHPYRMDFSVDPPRIAQGGPPGSPIVAIPVAVEGVFGVNGKHGPDGWINGSLEFAQRDFVLQYVEWLHSQFTQVSSGITLSRPLRCPCDNVAGPGRGGQRWTLAFPAPTPRQSTCPFGSTTCPTASLSSG